MTRKQCLEKWIKENRSVSSEDGLKATVKEATALFQKELSDALTKASKD